MSGFHRHYAGRFVFYVPVGGAWGYLCEDFIMRFLTSYFNVHMTYSTNLNIALCCTGVGLAIGLVVAIVVENKMNNYRYTLEKKAIRSAKNRGGVDSANSYYFNCYMFENSLHKIS